MHEVKESDEAAILSVEDIAAADEVDDRIAKLDATVIRSLTQRRQLSVEIGRALSELKQVLGHGKWQRHFEETFEPRGLSLRRAERYMRRAREADAVAKIDKMSIFKAASDEDAQDIRKATKEARAETAAASRPEKVKKDTRHIYRLSLRMTHAEKDAMDTLRALPDWPHAEKKILSLLRRLWIKHGVVRERNGRQS